jgi:integrase
LPVGLPHAVGWWRVRIDHDQAFQSTGIFPYQHKAYEWVSLKWRYDSGVVVNGVPDYMFDQLRDGEALALKWPDVHMKPAPGGEVWLPQVQKGKSVKARRTVSLTARVQTMLEARFKTSSTEYVFPGKTGKPILVTSLDHQHVKVRELLKLPEDFVVHSLRHRYTWALSSAVRAADS